MIDVRADQTTGQPLKALAVGKPRSQFHLGLRQVVRNPLATTGLGVIVLMFAIALAGTGLMTTDPLAQNMGTRVLPPSWQHLFGTDNLGRDVFSRLVYGSRASLMASTGAVVLSFLAGVPLGLLAGYFGSRVDSVIMRCTDAVLSFPTIVLAIALVATLGPGTANVMLAIGLVNIPVFARLVRGSSMSAKAEEYVEAARAMGAGHLRIMLRHVLPSSIAPVTVQIGASFSLAILAESTLSFLGLGIQAPNPSWGMMLNDSRSYVTDAPWLVIAPAAWISLAVLAVNFLGDGLRDALDPRYRAE